MSVMSYERRSCDHTPGPPQSPKAALDTDPTLQSIPTRCTQLQGFFWDWNQLDTNWHTEHVLSWPGLCQALRSHEQTVQQLTLNAEGCEYLMVRHGVEYETISLYRLTALRYLEVSARGLLGYQSNINTAVYSLGEQLPSSLELASMR